MKKNDIYVSASDIFLKNLDYFKRLYPAIYKKIIDFQTAQKSGSYKNRYELEYTNSSFNLYNIKQKSFFYEKSHDHFDKHACNSLTDSSTNFAIRTIPIDMLNKEYSDTVILSDTSKVIKEIKYLTDNFNFKKEKEFNKTYKFIFLGTMLGTHLKKILKKINAKSYLIIEPDVEIFFLSLFVTKYYEFEKYSNIDYSVMDSNDILLDKLDNFYELGFNKNYLIKYFLATTSYSYLFDTVSLSLARLQGMSYTYISYLKNVSRTVKSIKNQNNILNLQKNSNVFGSKPVLIIAPGPSLKNNLKWLKKYQDKFIIVSFSQTLKRLLAEDIKPDIITVVDYTELIYKDFDIKDKSVLKKTLLFACTNVQKRVLNLFEKNNLFLYEKDILLKPDISKKIFSSTIGETTYALILLLNAQKIYLLGTDLCINQQTGNTHDEMHSGSGNAKVDMKDIVDFNVLDNINQKNDLIYVPGNLEETVLTTYFYKKLIINYNNMTELYKNSSQKVYNLSNGAKIDSIDGFKDIKQFKEFKTINKKKLHKKLQQKFISISSNSFSQKEKEEVFKELKNIKDINEHLNILLQNNIDSYTAFDINTNKVIDIVLQDYNTNANNYIHIRNIIFYNYFSIHCNFIDYMLNSKNKSDNYDKFFKKFIQSILELLHNYSKVLQKTLS